MFDKKKICLESEVVLGNAATPSLLDLSVTVTLGFQVFVSVHDFPLEQRFFPLQPRDRFFFFFFSLSVSVAARETSLWEGRGAKSTSQKCQFAMGIRPVAGVDPVKQGVQYSVLSEYHKSKSAAGQ